MARIERSVLAHLEAHGKATVAEITAALFEPPAQPADSAAVRRAIASLRRRGLVVKLGWMVHDRGCDYASLAEARRLAAKEVRAFGLASVAQHHPELFNAWAADEQ